MITAPLPPKIIASFNPDLIQGCNPFTVDFTNNSTGGTLNHLWDFGDSTSSSTKNSSHTFYNYSYQDLTVPVNLTTTASNSCSDKYNCVCLYQG